MGFNWYQDRTPEQWAAEADNFRRMAQESAEHVQEYFDRDETYAESTHVRLATHYRVCADLCDAHGVQECQALFDRNGNLVSTQLMSTQYGRAWLTTEAHVKSGGRQWVSPSKAKKGVVRYRNTLAMGYTIGTIRVRCGVFLRAASPHRVVDMIEPLRDTTHIEIITTDNGIGENWS